MEVLSFKDGGSHVAFSPDGKLLASGSMAQGGAPADLKVWDTRTGMEHLTLKGYGNGRVSTLAFSPDGKRLIATGNNFIQGQGPVGSELKIWDMQTGVQLVTLKDNNFLASVSMSANGKRLAGASGDVVKILDSETCRELLTLKGHTDFVMEVVFSPDGKRLASSSIDGSVKLWDAATGEELLSVKGSMFGLLFSPDGQWLVGGRGGSVIVFDATPLPDKR